MIRPKNKTKTVLHTHTPHTYAFSKHEHKSADTLAHANTNKMEAFLKWSYDVWISSRRSLRGWSPCWALYLFFTSDLLFRLSSRRSHPKPLGVLSEVGLLSFPWGSLSSCPNQWQGWGQIGYPGWERDYGSVPSAGIQQIQAVKDFLDIRKRFHEIYKDLTTYYRFHVV